MPDLVAALHDGITTVEDHWDDSVLHVSDLGATLENDKCPRELYLRLRGARKREPTLGQLMRFDHGHRIHERLTEVIRRGLTGGWEVLSVEQSLLLEHKGICVKGSADVYLGRPGTKLVVDYKTKRGRAFRYLHEAKPGNVLQVQGYVKALDADAGVLLYVDREGENEAVQFTVERDDQAVEQAIEQAAQIISAAEPPPILAPSITVKANKGPDAVYLGLPWQCDYCSLRDVSCPGAIPYAERESLGLVGHVLPDGTFRPKQGMESAERLVLPVLQAGVPLEPAEAA
jgi:CRISPR/Cas system-associated exonuclease Cas4 (RecB family)